MALTPEDVVNKRFQPTKFREGYDQDEVDDFLDEVVVELRRLNQENEELKQRLVAADVAAVKGAQLKEAAEAGVPALFVCGGYQLAGHFYHGADGDELQGAGVLDLHTFQPREVKDLVLDYLAECQTRGILRVRIIHGKGLGQLRQTVHSILKKHPDVAEFHLASEHSGGWGATIVHLSRKDCSETGERVHQG